MDITVTHTGGFLRDTRGLILRALYFKSKFPKEIGDKITVDGLTTYIEVIGEDRNDTIEKMNVLIREHNKTIKNLKK